jgi:predicted transcriptional regulator
MYDIEFINYRLRAKGITFAAIADDMGVTRSAVTQALQCKKRGKSKRIIREVERIYRDLYGEPLPQTLQALAA